MRHNENDLSLIVSIAFFLTVNALVFRGEEKSTKNKERVTSENHDLIEGLSHYDILALSQLPLKTEFQEIYDSE